MEFVSLKAILAPCLIVIGFLPLITEGLRCYQCNVFIRGTPWTCEDDRGMRIRDDCVSCVKSYTRTYLHNTFHDQLLTSYESRLCVRSRDYSRDDGCYSKTASNGYMKRCYCHTDLCNAASRQYVSNVTFVTSVLVVLAGMMNLIA